MFRELLSLNSRLLPRLIYSFQGPGQEGKIWIIDEHNTNTEGVRWPNAKTYQEEKKKRHLRLDARKW